VGTLLATPAVAAPAPAQAPAAVAPADSTTHVQQLLKGFGYSVVVDGIYGPQTTRAVKHFQKANDLLEDGIAGPITIARLESSKVPTATVPAVRVNPPKPAPPAPVASGDVESIIRDVWPDDLENEAVRIATRESRLVPTARNACCHGLFQIYYSVHRAWLGQYGVNSPSDLYDPRTNATVALALYNEAGWGPWAL